MAPQFSTIDQYIKTFPESTQIILEKLRQTIRSTAPAADEAISYQIPTFKLNGNNLVHFAGYKHHIGVYPVPQGSAAFEKQLAPYKAGKGTVRFPIDKPIPYGLVKKIVAFRLKETQAKEK